MIQTVDVQSVFPRVMAYAPNAPDPAVREAVLRGARQLCRKTQVWKEWMGPNDPLDGVTRYQLMAPMDAELCAVTESDPEDLHGVIQVVSGGMYVTVDFPETPKDVFSIRAAFMPRLDSETLPAMLVDEWDDVLVPGALAFLMNVPKSDWTDHRFAAQQLEMFRVGMGRMRVSEERGRRNAGLTVRTRRFA